jgi:type IV pilus secretin PilQ/predicted competence protein
MRARLAWALSLIAALLLGYVDAQEPAMAVISDIRQESADDSTRLVVVSNGPLTYTYYSPDPLTLIVDLPDVDVSKVPTRLNVGTSEVESLRVTPMARGEGRSLARLEVRLARRAPYSIYSKDKTLNLVFERAAGEPRVAAKPAAAPPVAPPEAAPAPEPRAAAAKPAESQPAEVKAAETKRADAVALDGTPDANAPTGPVTKATKILGVSHQGDDSRFAVTVKADGKLRYQDFFVGNPDRLVIDFPDVSSGPNRNQEVKSEPVRKLRLAQFSPSSPKVARLVLELSHRTPYRVVETADGVKVVFGEGESPSPAPLAALRTDNEPAVDPLAAPANLTSVPILTAPAPVAAPAGDADPQLGQGESFEPRTVGPGEKKYTGHPISLDFKDGDLQDIFRLFADISGLNVVVNPGVAGKVTLKLNEVPWDQALDLILKTNGLGYTLEDNVIRIARLTDLQKEEADRRKLAEEKALAGDLQVWRKRLSYAKADSLQPTVQKVALSARGTITLDSRTNTMIITDLPANIEKAKDLILDLDRATDQVEIEARIVVTTRNFTRDMGIQWGFMNQMTPRFGNTTGMNFPNSVILNGGGVPGGGLNPQQVNNLSADSGIGELNRGYAVNLPASAVNSALGVSMGNLLGNFNLDVALTALESRGRGRILSTPKVTTQNNQAAEIKQGIQIAYQTFSAQQGSTVSFKDVFLILKVTPQITEAGTVILGLEVENNSADFSRQVNGVPPINIQSVRTQVLVSDGSTAVIGGIYQQAEQISRNQTPIFGDLPLLGYLFRNRSLRNENTELIVFITPRIVKG